MLTDTLDRERYSLSNAIGIGFGMMCFVFGLWGLTRQELPKIIQSYEPIRNSYVYVSQMGYWNEEVIQTALDETANKIFGDQKRHNPFLSGKALFITNNERLENETLDHIAYQLVIEIHYLEVHWLEYYCVFEGKNIMRCSPLSGFL